MEQASVVQNNLQFRFLAILLQITVLVSLGRLVDAANAAVRARALALDAALPPLVAQLDGLVKKLGL
jgi:hypothetical protein